MKNIFKKNHIIITALAIMIVIAGYLSFTNRDAADNKDSAVVVNPDTDEYDAYTEVDGVDVVTNTGTDANGTTTDTTTTDTTTTDTTDTNGTDNNAADNTVTDTTDTTTDDTNAETTTDENATDTDNTGDLGKNDISDEDILATAQDVTDNGELNLEEGVPGEAVLASTSISSSYFISSRMEREQVRAKNKETLMDIIKSNEVSDKAKKDAVNCMIEYTKISEKESATELMLEAKGFADSVVFIVDDDVKVVVNAKTLSDQQLAIIESVVKENTEFSVDHININTVVTSE